MDSPGIGSPSGGGGSARPPAAGLRPALASQLRCPAFATRGRCAKGDRCHLAHGSHEAEAMRRLLSGGPPSPADRPASRAVSRASGRGPGPAPPASAARAPSRAASRAGPAGDVPRAASRAASRAGAAAAASSMSGHAMLPGHPKFKNKHCWHYSAGLPCPHGDRWGGCSAHCTSYASI